MSESTNSGVLPGTSLVVDLALRLHQQKGTGLRIEVPSGSVLTAADLPVGCRIVDETAIQFDSLAARNTIVAQAAFEGLQSELGIGEDALFERARELWRDEIGHDDQASGRLLSLASPKIDILSVAAKRIRSGSSVFEVLHLVQAALPHLPSLEASSIVELFIAKFEPTKNDMAAGVIHGALEEWLKKRPGDARKLHQYVVEQLSDATATLLGNAVSAIAATDYAAAVEIALADVRAGSPIQAPVGVWTLGRLLLDSDAKPASVEMVVREVSGLIENEQGELRSHAIRAAVGAMHAMGAFDPILERLAVAGDQDVLCAAARALLLRAKELGERGVTQRWLEWMVLLKPEFKGAISDFDYAMTGLLSTPSNEPIIVSTLSKWVSNHGQRAVIDSATSALFDDTLRKLTELDTSWTSLVTDWLLSSEDAHPAALAGYLSQLGRHSGKELRLDKGRLDALTTEGLLFLARRLLGYVHDREQLTSLSLSMLKSDEPQKRIFPVLRELLVDEIGYDYPGSTADACRKIAETVPIEAQKDFLLKVADAITQVTDAQSALPMRNELRPPTRLSRLFARARAKQMDESFDEASKDSIWRSFATQIVIKAGRGTFSYRDASYGPSMKLSSMSHSIELPRREAFDPIGNSIRHFGFRIAKRGE